MSNPLFLPALVTVVGFLIMGLGGIVFRVRALANKPAWNGATLPLVLIGLVVFIIGLVMLFTVSQS